MLTRLSIRDIVLIERLDIEFASGLAVLTGETGAGKSILLDAFALALGGRGDAGLVRHGAEQGQVTAVFEVPGKHPASAILAANGLDDQGEGDMILRRVQLADGRTRAFINDQPISVQTLKAVGAALVEIHGQHDERALVDATTHRRLLDAFAGLDKDVAALEGLWEARRTARAALDDHRAGMERAAREADYLRHASDELKKLAPQDGEETALGCNEPQEIRGYTGHSGARQQSHQRLFLLLGGKNRALDETPEIGTLGDERRKVRQIARNTLGRLLLLRQGIKRLRIAASHTRYDVRFLGYFLRQRDRPSNPRVKRI